MDVRLRSPEQLLYQSKQAVITQWALRRNCACPECLRAGCTSLPQGKGLG